jgi:3',5'-cyclic-nucleotide phosphodiesterase
MWYVTCIFLYDGADWK